MTNTVKVENKGEGNVSLNDINQTVIINNNNNIKNILDEFNEVALRKGNDFSKFYAKIEDPNSFFYNISRKNLFLRNTFFSHTDLIILMAKLKCRIIAKTGFVFSKIKPFFSKILFV